MRKPRGLKLFPGPKRIQQESQGVDAQLPCVMNGKSSGVSTRSGRHKVARNNVPMMAPSPVKGGNFKQQKNDQFQVQMIASILTKKHSGSVPEISNSCNLEQSRSLKTANTTARRLADKVVKRTLQIASKPSRVRKLPSSGATNLQVKETSSNFRGKSYKAVLNASGENVTNPRNSVARLLRSRISNATCITDTRPSGAEKKAKKRHRQKRKKRLKEPHQDDASRIKNRVKYLLNRIKLEQNLIDAYSAEGWKGQSREKIRPEKELQRAESQILQCKLGIREAVHQLDLLGLEGSIEDSVFDAEGQIYHEDIFCAKCKSQEALPENDIILCDGACNRAFHQLCLDPPLKTEDIPPGDEGWLCPICDCKLECLDIVNAYLGTNYDVEDDWQKIFAEAAALANGEGQPVGVGQDWPSEDSEDDDYNPDGDVHETGQKTVERDLAVSASESSSSSGSASGSDSSDDDSEVSFFDEFAERKKRVVKNKGEDNLRNEIEETLLDDEDSAPLVEGKRQRKEVDYKKLHDEMFGKNDSDSEHSEDEEWGPRKKGKKAKQLDGASQKDSSEVKSEETKNVLKNGEKAEVVSGISSLSQGKRSCSRLPLHAVERLREVFSQNQLPSRACKDELSRQLGISVKQVKLWFKNMRYAALKKGLAQKSARARARLPPSPTATNTGEMPGDVDGLKDILVQIEKLDQAQLKIENLKSTLEGTPKMKESDFVMYVPVAELKEKVHEVTAVR